MQIVDTVSRMQQLALEYKRSGKTIGLVPTMGYLHEGHLSLLRCLRPECDVLVVSVFVNPTQFGPNEDLESYPRDFAADEKKLEAEAADIVFYPPAAQMYFEDSSVSLQENELSSGLCGASRPVHFGGVLTVVAKLFNICLPDTAVFGEKDAQQIRLIRRMVRDLNFPVRIVGAPIVREADGLAMSSRNANLRPGERVEAPAIKQALDVAASAFAEGERSAKQLIEMVRGHLESKTPLGVIDYIELVDDETLTPVEGTIPGPALLAVAVQYEAARLIDNCVLKDGE